MFFTVLTVCRNVQEKAKKPKPHTLQIETVRQTRMAFARMDHQKQNYERRMKKHAEREMEKEMDEYVV